MIAVAVGRRGASALVSILVLSLFVGLALVGFYQPAWRIFALANPLTLGALSLGHLGALSLEVLAPPMLALTVITAVTIAVGARLAGRLEV